MSKFSFQFKLAGMLLISFQSAFGLEYSSENSFSEKMHLENNLNKNSFNLDFSLLGIQYLSHSDFAPSFQQKAQIEGFLEKSFSYLDIKFYGFAGSYSVPHSSFFAVPEAFAGITSENKKNYLHMGRKIENLSFLDQNLHLGLYNPYYSYDLIEYNTLGLVGIHGQVQYSLFGMNIGYLPLYLPNQGPPVYEENGEIQSSSRWAQRPPSQFQFGNQNREIIYAIKNYDIQEIVNNSGYYFSAFTGRSEVRPWIRASFSRKPISEIPLSRDTYGTAVNFQGQVKLLPTVTYSQIRSIDMNVDTDRFKTTLSYIEDQPENKIALEDETLQFLEPLKIYGIWLSTDLSDWIKKTVITEISYAEISDGAIKDLMTDGRPSIFTFSSQRTLFKKPFAFKVQSNLFYIKAKPVITSLKWTYDRYYKGSLFTGLLKYEALAKMNINVGFDILGVEDEKEFENHFLKANQGNDRFYGGLDYVF